MKCALQASLLLIFCVGCLAGEPAVFQPQLVRSNIVAVLPSGWSIIPQSSTQERDTKAYFDDPRVEAFILMGPKRNYFDWTDKQGKAHRDYLAKECLWIWLVPPDFTPKFPHWWTDPPPLPKRVCSSRAIKVYGQVYQHIVDTNRWHTILDKECMSISSPAIHLSWTNWQRDISGSLKKMK
jgi:hypothetical protein